MSLKILAAVRSLIAEARFENIGIGEVMSSLILNEYILPLQQSIESGVETSAADEYEAQITDWVNMSDPDIWNKIALVVVQQQLRKFGFRPSSVPIEDIEDETQNAALLILQKVKEKRLFLRHVDPFDMSKGPQDIKSLFGTVVANATKNSLSQAMRHAPRMRGLTPDDQEYLENEHANEVEMVDKINKGAVQRMYQGLMSFIKKRTGRNPMAMTLFEAWLAAVQKIGDTAKVKFKTHVYRLLAEKLEEQGESLSYTHAARIWKGVKTLIISYFEDQLDWRLSDRLKRRLMVADCIAKEASHRVLAQWVLGKGRIAVDVGDGFVTPEEMVMRLREEKRQRSKQAEVVERIVSSFSRRSRARDSQ